MAEWLLLLMLFTLAGALLSGYPVAFTLAGVSLLFALLGAALGAFDLQYIAAFPGRIWGIMSSDLLVAVPLFVFMGIMLERAKIAEALLEAMAGLLGNRRGGLGVAVMLVGALLAASTGIVGATVVTMGLISLPTMLRAGYCPRIAAGSICAAGTLGQVIPPSIVLILLGEQISNAWQTAQLKLGNMAAAPVSVADLFLGALLPGMLLVGLYLLWLAYTAVRHPERVPPLQEAATSVEGSLWHVLLPPLLLILLVLGSILAGIATATESAAMGAVGAMGLAWRRGALTLPNLQAVMRGTTQMSAMVFTILIGAALFTLVFRGYGGEDIVHGLLSGLPGGLAGALLVTMLAMFLLGFFLDFIEIIFIVVPIVGPVLLMMGADPVWLAVLIAVNLQTSFLTPPFGFALFYLRGVAPKSVSTGAIYRGIAPFVAIQLVALTLIAAFPGFATWLPRTVYGSDFRMDTTHSAQQQTPAPRPDAVAPTYVIDF